MGLAWEFFFMQAVSPLDYLHFYYTSGAYKKRVVLLSILLVLEDSNPDNPAIGQVAFFNNQYQYWNEQWIPLATVGPIDRAKPYLHYKTPITLPANFLPGVNKEIHTQVGNVVDNILCVITPFKGRVPFMEGTFDAGKIEAAIEKRLVDEDRITEPNAITPSMLNTYIIASRMLMSISGLFIVSATPKNIVGAPGMEEFKAQQMKKYDLSKPLDQASFTNDIIKYDAEYLKDDPSLGILISGKAKNKARVKLFGAFGIEITFGTGKTTSYISHGLEKGVPTDAKTYSEVYTASRAASYSRGRMTQIGGVLGKLLARLMAAVKIVDGDCGSKTSLPFIVDKNNTSLLNRYAMIDGKPTLVTPDLLPTSGTTLLNIRSPGHCISPDTSFCRVCAGEKLYASKDGVRLAAMNLSDVVLSLYLSMFHGMDRTSVEISFDEIAN